MLIKKFPAIYSTRNFSNVFVYKIWYMHVEWVVQIDVYIPIIFKKKEHKND